MQTSKSRNQIIPAIIFLLPGFALFFVFFLGPLLYSLRISFFNWNFVHPDRSVFVGFQNYINELKSPIFHRAVINTRGIHGHHRHRENGAGVSLSQYCSIKNYADELFSELLIIYPLSPAG